MSAYSSVFGVVVVLLLHLSATHSFPTSLQVCPVPCLCQRGPLLNCSSLGLTKTPVRIPATAISLNLSHNALHSLAPLSSGRVILKGLLHLWVGSNSLDSLDLDLKKNWSSTRTLSHEKRECTSWAPDLQLLSAERNHLKHLPKGLNCLKSLQILQLSYNQIFEIGPADLNLTSLKELHLQHNHIRNIHSHAFIGLQQLQVLDLSYNLLVTIPVPAYRSVRSLNAFVNISFNRWKCDCNLRTLRRWIGFDTEVGDASWSVVCNSPPHYSGKDLLDLKDSDLTCPTREYSTFGHRHNMIVDEGTQILISCSNDSQEFMQVQWWTPHGQVADNQPQLVIEDITQQQEGLYICVSGLQWEHISVFDIKVYTKGSGSRPRREAPTVLDGSVERENTNLQRTQSEFVLAVCLSVIITFIVAFILGVLLRPLFDKLYMRIRSKKHSSPSPTTSGALSTGPQPCVNEGYYESDDQERVVRMGSRVTFGDITEVGDRDSNMPYYVTVEDVHSDGSSESNTEVEPVYANTQKYKSSEWRQQALEVDHHRGRANSNSSSTTQEGEVNVLVTNNKAPSSTTALEFEPIPDATTSNQQPIPDADDVTQPRRTSTSSSSSSSSSHSMQTLDKSISSQVRESTEQSVDPTSENNATAKDKVPGFTTTPFTEWPTSLTEQSVDGFDAEFWNDSGESFSFNEDSERSSVRDLSASALGHPVTDDDTWRQGNTESPANKLNFNSHVVGVNKPFGKEVSVDDLPDTLSSSSSSESGDSDGPNSYTVNPALEEESEILKESYKKTDSERFSTPEDGSGILNRQETITLDPSDIHLTFTREESVDEVMLTDDSQRKNEDAFGSWIDVSLGTVPKIKRYVQFTQSKLYPSAQPSLTPPSTKSNVTPEIEVKSEAKVDTSPEEASCLTQTKVSIEGISKVKRYIHFKQSEPHFPTLPTSPTSVNKDGSSTSSENEDNLISEGNILFRKTGVSSDEVPKVKRYIAFKQIEPSSQTLSVFSPSTEIEATTSSPSLTNKDISGKIYLTDHNKQLYSSNLSPEGLPLYHVHPSYRTKQNRPNRDYDTDRSSSESSSEDEDQLTVYPRKLEIKTEPEINRGTITSDKVLNIDFDNSSSSTDVFEKKHSKGLTRLKVLGTRLFSKRENETDEKSVQSVHGGSTSSRRPGVVLDLAYKTHSKLTETEEIVQEPNNEDSFFGHIGLSFDQLKRPKKSLLFTISDPQLPDQLSSIPLDNKGNKHDKKEDFESRRSSLSSSSDEGSISPKHEKDILGQRLSLDQPPKVKRYLQFSYSDPHSQAQLPFPPPTNRVVTPDLIAKAESKRSSSSSADDVKQPTEGENFYGLPKVKRYIAFSHTEPYSTTQQLNNQSISPNKVAPTQSRKSSSSSEDDIKSSSEEDNFTETIIVSASQSSTKSNVTSKIDVKSEAKVDTSPEEASYLTQTKVSVEGIPKVKRYIHFKQSEPHYPTLPTSPSSINKDVRVEAKRFSTLSEDKLTTEKDDFSKINVSLDGVSKVKRYIKFKQLEPTSPILSVPSPSTKIEPTTGAEIKSMQSSSSSEDEDSPTAKENEFFGKTGVSLVRLPEVKRYIEFKQAVSHPSVVSPTTSLNTPHVTLADKTNLESRKLSTSSEDDTIVTAEKDNFLGQTEGSFDGIPKVKRYINFTQRESQSSVQSTTSQRVSKPVVVQETRKSSTSYGDDIKLSTKDDMIGKTDESFVKLPKVQRYIKFTQYKDFLGPLPFPVKSVNVTETEPSILAKDAVPLATSKNKTESRTSSTSSEDDVSITAEEDHFEGQTGPSLQTIPKVKRYIHFTQSEPHSPAQPTTAQSVVQETRRSSTSSGENVIITAKEANFKGQTGPSIHTIPKVKRYIHFTQPEQHFPVQPTTAQSVVQETRGSSTSSDKDVKTNDDNFYLQTGSSFDQLPKVKRYIEFKQHKSPFPVNPLAMEDITLNTQLNRLSMTSIKTYPTPKAKADIQTGWSSSSSEASPPGSIKKRSPIVIQSQTLRSEFHYKDIMTRDSVDGYVQQTGLKPELKNDPPAVPPIPPPSLELEDAREYLRDNSEVRQRQERRRLLQQRRVMDEFSATTLSPITQEGNKQDSGSLVNYGGATMTKTVTTRRNEGAEAPTLQGLKTKNISALRSKSPLHSENTKYKEFLI
nr:serine-rich adhesin for platelets-like [Misgurnus anguillicaudatus]